mgnify:CR=1 FL=1
MNLICEKQTNWKLQLWWAITLMYSYFRTQTSSSDQGIMFLPFGAIYVAGEIGIVSLETNNLLIISGVLLLVDALLFFVSRSTFRREEILTKWK